MQETWVQILSLEDPLEQEMATSPVFLPRKTPWTKKKKKTLHGRPWGHKRVGHNLATKQQQLTLLVKLEFLFFS